MLDTTIAKRALAKAVTYFYSEMKMDIIAGTQLLHKLYIFACILFFSPIL